MDEKIIEWHEGTGAKKYKVIVVNKDSGEKRTIQFGARGWGQYKDSTPLGVYKRFNHKDLKRRKNYFSRHSGLQFNPKRGLEKYKWDSIKHELKKSKGKYNAKILSHLFLW